MHLPKKGLRAFGIAESYTGRERSCLCGVVMRKDLIIDGFAWGEVTVGGLDSTDTVLAMFRSLGRQDINCILLSGCVIAWFNVIDIDRLHAATGLPVICVTYEDSEGLERDIESHFPGDPWRLASYRRLGERKAVSLNTGYTAYLRS